MTKTLYAAIYRDMSRMHYNKLWKLLIDKGMTRTQLRQKAGISTNVLAKMGKGEVVSMESLLKVAEVLDCEIGEIVEASKDTMFKGGADA